jgi:inner membrane protein
MTNYVQTVGEKLRDSVTVKLFVTVVLALILLIPAEMIQSLIRERANTRQEAETAISAKWGAEQTLGSPVLSVPYRTYIVDSTGKRQGISISYAHFLPEELKITGDIAPEVRYYGIFDVVVYTAKLKINGTLKPSFNELNVKPEDVLWGDAVISMGIPDMRGINQTVFIDWDGGRRTFGPGVRATDLYASGVSVALDTLTADTMHSFAIDLSLNGSRGINFLPLGRQTSVEINSSWPNPSFSGAFLPGERSITDAGFKAKWTVLDLNRNYPQRWTGNTPTVRRTDGGEDYASYDNAVDASAFGVGLIVPVDHYQQSLRSAKYAGLFIALTFLTFFLIEILNRLRLHPIQYLLVGCALVLFYLLLVSLSEHLSFGTSYAIACTGIVGLVTFYAASVFRRLAITAITFVVVAALYGYLYVLLQMEDYTLLLGSVGLFLILAAVMYVTRKMDWYAVGKREPKEDEPASGEIAEV